MNLRQAAARSSAHRMADTTQMRCAPAASTSSRLSRVIPPMANQGTADIRRRPPHIFERDGFGGGFGAGRINRTDPQIIRARGHRPPGLFGRGAAQPNPDLRRQWLSPPCPRITGFHSRSELGDLGVARAEEIILAQMAELRAQFLRQGRVIVDHQRDAGPLRYWQNRLSQAADLVERRFAWRAVESSPPRHHKAAARSLQAPARAGRWYPQRRKAGIHPTVS